MSNISGVNPPILNDQDYVDKIKDSLNAIDSHDHSSGKGLPIASGGIAPGAIVNADVNAAAAIARTKIASGTADHVLINSGAGVMSSEAQLAKTRGGTGVSSTATFPSSGVVVTETAVETLTNKTITLSTPSRALVTDGSSNIIPATTTAAEIGFVNGVTSAIQTQLDARVSKSAYTAKGSLLVATAASTPANLAVGADNLFLKADSSQASGVVWASPSSAGLSVTSKTAGYTATTADEVILCDATSAAFTITLYAAATNSGKRLIIKKTDSSVNAVTIDGNASETIDGATTTTLNTQNEVLTIICDGTNWQIQERRIPSFWATDTGFTVGGPGTSSTAFQSKRVGDVLFVQGKCVFTTSGSGSITIALAGSRTVDTTKLIDNTVNGAMMKGIGNWRDVSATTNYQCVPIYTTTDTVRFYNESSSNAAMSTVTDLQPFTIAAGDTLSFFLELPITGWNG